MKPLLTCLALILSGCTPGKRPADNHKLLPEEKLVRAYVLDHADLPESVEFLEWGPHDLEGEIFTALVKRSKDPHFELPDVPWNSFGKTGIKPQALQVVRVKYEYKVAEDSTRTTDALAYIQDEKVIRFSQWNKWGKDWQPPARKWVREVNELFDQKRR